MIIRKNITLSFLALCVFMILRPLFTISFFETHTLFGLKLVALFTIFSSYGFIILLLASLKQYHFDGVSYLLFLFCLYCGFSIMWGSDVRELTRIILPPVIFYVVRMNVKKAKQLRALIQMALLGYVVPILGSAYLTILNKMSRVNYWSGLVRHSGMYGRANTHPLAHSMLIFLFFIILYLYFTERSERRKIFILFLYCLSLAALFNLVKAYVRTVFIGFYILLFFYFIGRRNYKLLGAVIFGSFLVIVTSSTFQKMMYDFIAVYQGQENLLYAGSGRVSIWTNILNNFIDQPFANQVLGVGLKSIAAPHNDFLSLLFNFGAAGLLIYVSFILKVFYDISKSCFEREIKYIYMGFVLAVVAMNLASNSYITRVELSQYFFFIIGTFYGLMDGLEEVVQV